MALEKVWFSFYTSLITPDEAFSPIISLRIHIIHCPFIVYYTMGPAQTKCPAKGIGIAIWDSYDVTQS